MTQTPNPIRELVARTIAAPSGGIRPAHERAVRLAVLLINNAGSEGVYEFARWLRENGHTNGIPEYLGRQLRGEILSFTEKQQYRLEYVLRVLTGEIG